MSKTLIFCEEEHTYWLVDTEPTQTDFKDEAEYVEQYGALPKVPLMSVTTFLHQYTQGFDADEVIEKMMKGSEIYLGKNEEYQGMNVEEIKTLWNIKRDRAARYGTYVHLGAENYALKGVFDAPSRPEFTQVKNYFKQNAYDVAAAEKRIHSDKYMLAGTVDLLLSRDETVGAGGPEPDVETVYYVADWKTNNGKDLADTTGDHFTKTMKFPLVNVPDLPYWHYALQFSLYRYLLEEIEGLKIVGQEIVHLKRTGTEAEIISTPYMKKEIEALLYLRMEEINDELSR